MLNKIKEVFEGLLFSLSMVGSAAAFIYVLFVLGYMDYGFSLEKSVALANKVFFGI